MNKRVFLSAAPRDLEVRDSLVARARRGGVNVQFVDYAVKEAWDNVWRANCRTRITGCDGLIAIVGDDASATTSQRWEIECAQAERVSVLLVPPAPLDLWWPRIAAFLDAL